MSILYKLFLIPFFSGIAVIPLLISFSKKTGKVLDISEGDALKIHKQPTSLLGGLAILLSVFIGLSFMVDSSVIFLAIGMLVIFALGFWDDLRWKNVAPVNPLLKFAALVICSLAAAIALGYIGISITLAFVAIFIFINAVNYQDGIDGLAGGLCAISFLGFFLIGALPLSLIALGAATAFLLFNFPPAKVFMGDSGAYLLGFLLAVLACLLVKPDSWQSIISIIFIIGLPLFDGVFTNLRRLAKGKSIFHGDRSHVYDQLLVRGFSTKKTLALCYGLQLLFVIIGLLIFH